MKWEKYGITLSRITEEDIELIRQWRNSPQIMQNMQYREYITSEMQKKWFESVNNFNNFYYLIIYNGEKIGLINNKNVDWEKRTSEAGVFIWDKKYDFATLIASLLLCEVGFYIMQGGDSSITVLRNNHNAIEYNTHLGYELVEDNPENDSQVYLLTKQSFESKTRKLREAVLKLSGNDNVLRLILEKHDHESGLTSLFEKIKEDFKLNYSYREENGEKIYIVPFDDILSL